MLFDPDDRGTASVEGLERLAAGEAATGGLEPYVRFVRAFQHHDWEAARQVLAPDFELVDHRILGLGTLDRDQRVASLRAQTELSPDLAADALRILAWNEHGLAVTVRTFGTVPDGGPFENVFVHVVLIAGDRIRRIEPFDVTHTERAVARFEELRFDHVGRPLASRRSRRRAPRAFPRSRFVGDWTASGRSW